MEEQDKTLLKFQKAEERKMEKVRENTKKNPHAIISTLEYDAKNAKYRVQIQCVTCGDKSRWVFTSDLHQIKQCVTCQANARKAKSAERRAEIKKIRTPKEAVTA